MQRTIVQRLDTAKRATKSALKPGPLAILKENGYTAAKINAGRAIYTTADEAVSAALDALSDQQNATQFVGMCGKAARGTFQDFAKTARAVFVKDKSALAKLGLNKPMPEVREDFLKAADVLFKTDNYTPEMAAALLEVGWDSPDYSVARSKIAEFDTAMGDQLQAISDAQKATGAQTKALKAMDEWMAKFIKICRVVFKDEQAQFLESFKVTVRTAPTKKQRDGRKKAAATRAGKKLLKKAA